MKGAHLCGEEGRLSLQPCAFNYRCLLSTGVRLCGERHVTSAVSRAGLVVTELGLGESWPPWCVLVIRVCQRLLVTRLVCQRGRRGSLCSSPLPPVRCQLSIRSSWKQLARPALSAGPGWDGHELGVPLRLPRSGPQDQRSPGDVPFLPSERLTVLFHAVPSKGL